MIPSCVVLCKCKIGRGASDRVSFIFAEKRFDMANGPKRPCLKAGCHELIDYPSTYCDMHKPKQDDTYRPSAHKRGYNTAWRRYRQAFLIKSPLCVECDKRGQIREATVVDHIIPHKGDMKLFWDKDNHQPMCKRCHNIKTATRDGGFGRASK